MKSKNPNFKKNLTRLAQHTKKRQEELLEIERNAIANFHGLAADLTSAIGMLRFGDHVGWRVLLLIHSKKTIRKYEEILDIEVRDFFEEEGPMCDRSMGYKFVKTISNYWKAVSGDIKVENRRELN